MHRREGLQRLLRIFGVILAAAVLFVLIDFAVDVRPPAVQSSYRFQLPELPLDEPVILRQDNLQLVVIRRSPALLQQLRAAENDLQDAESKRSRQPAGVDPRHRAHHAAYFVAYAIGTDFGCPLLIESDSLRESCGKARYDFAGRALRAETRFPNLSIPDYNLGPERKILTVFP